MTDAPAPEPTDASEPAPAPAPAPVSAPEPAPVSAPEAAPVSAPEPAPVSTPEPAPVPPPEPASTTAADPAHAPKATGPSTFADIFDLQGQDSKGLSLQRDDRESALHPDLPWEDLIGEKTDVLQGLYDLEFEAPSRVQCQAIPVLTSDRPQSLIAQAPSGSGKTVAFVTSMFMRVDPHLKKLQAICLANTLELVQQTFAVCQSLNEHTKFSLGWCARGDLNAKPDVQVIIGTPSAVQGNAVSTKTLDISQVRILIIDEADELVKQPPPPGKLRPGEKPKNSFWKTINDLIKRLPPQLPIGFFSASFSDESINTIQKWRPDVRQLRKKEVPKEIRHFYFVTPYPDRDAVRVIVRLTRERFVSQGIFFVSKKIDTEPLAAALTRERLDCRWITGDSERVERVRILEDFRSNKFKFLTTTNMYARGIDIPEVFLVVQVGISRQAQDARRPNTVDYQHRAGRAGRFGRAGVCISFILDDEVRLIQQIEKELDIKIDRLTEDNFQSLPEDHPDGEGA